MSPNPVFFQRWLPLSASQELRPPLLGRPGMKSKSIAELYWRLARWGLPAQKGKGRRSCFWPPPLCRGVHGLGLFAHRLCRGGDLVCLWLHRANWHAHTPGGLSATPDWDAHRAGARTGKPCGCPHRAGAAGNREGAGDGGACGRESRAWGAVSWSAQTCLRFASGRQVSPKIRQAASCRRTPKRPQAALLHPIELLMSLASQASGSGNR